MTIRNRAIRSKIAQKVDPVTLLEAINSLRNQVQTLQSQVVDLQYRVRDLENNQQDETDRRGWEEQGPRYAGKHPYDCACDRCLSRKW